MLKYRITSATMGTIWTEAREIVPEVDLPYPNYTGALSEMLRPFPQYAGVTDLWPILGKSRYNSLQVTIEKRMSEGVSLNFNYTYDKGFDNLGYRNGYIKEKARTTETLHILNLMFVCRLRGAVRLSFQADAFNAFNWVRFSAPALNITSAGLRRIGGQANSPRAVRFSARLEF